MTRRAPKAEHVRSLIERDLIPLLGPADVLPAERLLAERFAVSRMTVRAALKLLEADGAVRSVPGVGTFAARPRVSKAPILSSFSEDAKARGYRPATRVIATGTVRADMAVALELGIEAGDEVHEVARVRLADDVPICVERVLLPAALLPGLLEHDLTGSLYALLAEAYGVRISRSDRRIRAVNIDREHADLLGVPHRSAALHVDQLSVDQHGRRVEHGRSLYRGDRYDFTTVTRACDAPGPPVATGAPGEV
ncbi:GntR family transcriptional regulator [Spinactinospora alkalitolerans]|uniref:GntR family transcriptional regulator n=1 Tax=Spinactinospora alkalitolerans TaxID=687207 RepID=A0A852U1Y0_9ACTN|nr:GntR family transcriptional regulator [Spinactinospora alkalitolerans]NYE48973.1 GntR family transcriptional regulator [Spinactinospora alkalitolerans]